MEKLSCLNTSLTHCDKYCDVLNGAIYVYGFSTIRLLKSVNPLGIRQIYILITTSRRTAKSSN